MSEIQPQPDLSAPVREARPCAWTDLTEQQRYATQRVGEILKGILGLPAGREPVPQGLLDEILPSLRQEHWNNVILIDGSRGSGKTTLMASILQAFGMRLRKQGNEDPRFFRDGREDGALPAGQVVPVAFLDLHPLPASTHLLFHLVGRLERVVRALEAANPSQAGPDMPAWRSSASTSLRSRERWNALSEVVSTAWEGNLAQRASSLDPEFYAWELAKIEKHRLGIAETFRSFVDALWADFVTSDLKNQHREPTSDPLFLMAVDDVDLVPHRSTEVLDLLRMLWHPRVVFLLTGDSDQLLTVLRNNFMGILLRPLSNVQIAGESSVKEDAASRSLLLARTTLDKIIPPMHRCKIESFSDGQKLEQMEPVLQALQIKASPKEEDRLYYYFKKDSYATKALPDQIRSLLNLKRELGRLAKVGEAPHYKQIAEAVAGLWRDLLQREPLLLGRERDVLSEVVRLDENGMLVVDSGGVDCRFTGRRVHEITRDRRSIALMRSQALVVSLRGERRALPDSINAALKLATNLVADIEVFHFLGESPAPNGFDLEPVVVRWEDSNAPGIDKGFTWSLPDWQGFLSTTLFVNAWNEIKRQAYEGDSEVSYLAKIFLKLVIGLAKSRRTDEELGELSWISLARRVKEEAGRDENSERQRRIRSWALGRAGLLAAPEGGLPKAEANLWLSSLEKVFDSEWPDVRARLAAERRQQIKDRWEGEQPVRSKVQEILDGIDRSFPEFAWIRKISEADRSSSSRQAGVARRTKPAPRQPD